MLGPSWLLSSTVTRITDDSAADYPLCHTPYRSLFWWQLVTGVTLCDDFSTFWRGTFPQYPARPRIRTVFLPDPGLLLLQRNCHIHTKAAMIMCKTWKLMSPGLGDNFCANPPAVICEILVTALLMMRGCPSWSACSLPSCSVDVSMQNGKSARLPLTTDSDAAACVGCTRWLHTAQPLC